MKITCNRACTALIVAGFVLGMLSQPGQAPGQSALAYILGEPPFLSLETLGAALVSLGIAGLFMGNSGGET